MSHEKTIWIQRFIAALLERQPHTPNGQLHEIAETFWYYQRHRLPEEAARERATGRLRMRERRDAWIESCSAAIRALDPQLGNENTTALAATLWEEDWARSVDPYLMAQALWDQALLLAMQTESEQPPPSMLSVLRAPGQP